jgi:hypothetical protein
METREDGYSYFIDYGKEDDDPRLTTEYKYKSLGDGNVEAYERDVSNQFIDTEYIRLQTMIKPDGSQNVILKTFSITLNNHLNISLHRKTSTNKGRTLNMPKRSHFGLSLDNELKSIMIENNMCIADFTNSAIKEKLEKEGLL